jgi:hypothetical protein
MNRPLFKFEETGVLQVLVVNWNMHGKTSAAREAPCKLFPRACPHHLYVVGTAECEKSIPKAVFNPKKKTWETAVRSALDGCTCIAEAILAATHLTVFARDDVAKHISNVGITTVATGFKGCLGNKGGILISMELGGRKFLFVQSHLPSGQKKSDARNKSAAKILGGMPKEDSTPPALDGPDHVFFLGDLNFRVDCKREEADKKIAIGDHASLLEKDQLTKQLTIRDENGQLKKEATNPLWRDFQEGAITFPPTYKYDRGTEYYDTSKKARVPSWTDRILWIDRQQIDRKDGSIHRQVELVAYNALKDVRLSDHKPVFAQFDVKLPDEGSPAGEDPATKRYVTRGVGCTIM